MKHLFLFIIISVLMILGCRGKNGGSVVTPPKKPGVGDSSIHGPSKNTQNPLDDFDKKYIIEKKALNQGMQIDNDCTKRKPHIKRRRSVYDFLSAHLARW